MATDADGPIRLSLSDPRFPAYGIRPVLIAAIIVLGCFVLLGDISIARAALGIAVIFGAACFTHFATRHRLNIAPTESASAQVAYDLVDAILAGLPDPTIALDGEGRVVAFNPPASSMAPALRRGELVSIALRVPQVVEAIRRVSGSGKPESVQFAERALTDRWSEAHLIPVSFDRGSAGGPAQLLLLTFHDLTPIRQVEEMRADFVANASHELRTPLAALSGFIETLKGPARDDAAARARFLDIMQAQATRMARLIDDLLSLSRIELAAHVRPITPVELQPVVRQVIDSLQTLARDRGVEVVIKAPAEPLTVPGDRDELIRVFENLIENALKYGAAGKRVDITLSRAATGDGHEEAVAAVRDYGPGISAEHLPRLTERFYRVDVAGSRAQGGTGLGLALVKHILNRHRGLLTIDSKAGKGATFTVRLPLAI